MDKFRELFAGHQEDAFYQGCMNGLVAAYLLLEAGPPRVAGMTIAGLAQYLAHCRKAGITPGG